MGSQMVSQMGSQMVSTFDFLPHLLQKTMFLTIRAGVMALMARNFVTASFWVTLSPWDVSIVGLHVARHVVPLNGPSSKAWWITPEPGTDGPQ